MMDVSDDDEFVVAVVDSLESVNSKKVHLDLSSLMLAISLLQYLRISIQDASYDPLLKQTMFLVETRIVVETSLIDLP